jgi:hypothetical protein
MPTAYARTDGTGRLLTGLHSLRTLSKEEMYGERIDPWMYVSKVSPGKGRPLHEFFAEDKYGDLVFRELDKYNLLLCHALRELNLDHTPELVHACAANGAKQIKIYDHYFLLSGGKIYRRGG